jgi:tripartite ATP-independent transporter DctM subunit
VIALEWWAMLIVLFGGLMVLFATGIPVAFGFLLINLVMVFILWGGGNGIEQAVFSMFNSVTLFTLLPVPLFLLMGDVMFFSGTGTHVMDALSNWMGKIPGKLSLVAVAAGTLFATLTGSSIATTVMMGSVLVPEMQKRGYSKAMSLGPILGAGGLAIMIPPSQLAVLIGAVGYISVGKLLIAIIIPGIMMAVIFSIYIVGRCKLQPSCAPAFDETPVTMSQKLMDTVKYILPIGFIIFLVVGVIFTGVCTPTEAAATGTVGAYLLAAAYGKFNWQMVKKSLASTAAVTGMVMFILMSCDAYGKILAFTGISNGLVEFATNLPVAPIVTIIGMQVVCVFMGMFVAVTPIIMIFVPLYMPIVNALHFDPVWFGAMFMLNMELGTITPPFGLGLFAMKGVAPKGTTMGDVFRAAIPFCLMDMLAMGIMLAFPITTQWLPALMSGK